MEESMNILGALFARKNELQYVCDNNRTCQKLLQQMGAPHASGSLYQAWLWFRFDTPAICPI
jgi:hypothetical protein